jgi:hypothetical protein
MRWDGVGEGLEPKFGAYIVYFVSSYCLLRD